MHYAKTASKLREQIIKFSGELSAGWPKVARRFIAEAIYGIQARQSVRLTEIARSLEVYFKNYPSLKEFYRVKEKLRDMYKAEDRKQGEEILDVVIAAMRVSDDGAILCWRNMLRRWKDQILNYFDNRTTDAFTEGVHTKIKKIKRVSYGFRNADIYVRKVALSFIPIALLPLAPHFRQVRKGLVSITPKIGFLKICLPHIVFSNGRKIHVNGGFSPSIPTNPNCLVNNSGKTC